jgi:phosphonate transport system substrate-binding protein
MNNLKITSCMAANADSTCRAIAAYLGDRLSIPTQFINNIPWQQREQLFDLHEIQLCWICGLPYVWKADAPDARIEPLVAPVMQGDRYQGRPIYFSDVIVRYNSSYQNFLDLRGTVWAYNEPRSHSGYLVTRAHLAILQEHGFFGQAVESGAHQTSLQWLLDGKIDATAIDSTVLETELRQRPHLRSQLRTIETLGPSPAPVWIVSTTVPVGLRQQLRSLFQNLHTDPQGQRILESAAIARFVAVGDRDYDPIREMARLAESVHLAP